MACFQLDVENMMIAAPRSVKPNAPATPFERHRSWQKT
jgi:hypothetical protein